MSDLNTNQLDSAAALPPKSKDTSIDTSEKKLSEVDFVQQFRNAAPYINAQGYVVWFGDNGSHSEIFLYDGTTITQLTDNSYRDAEPRINDSGYIAWALM